MNFISFILACSLFVLISSCGENNLSKTPMDDMKPASVKSDKPNSDEIPDPYLEQPPAVEKPTYKTSLKDETEQKIMDQIWKLKEVIELDATIRKKTKEQRGLSTFISSEPSDDQEYYGVSVAEDNGASYATYYQFHIYPDFSIRFYDVVEDQERSLKEWRESTK